MCLVSNAQGVPLEDLDPARTWRVLAIEIVGNRIFSDRELRQEMLTEVRPWYRPWGEHPVFDPVTFREDLRRVARFYEARGYYETEADYDLEVDHERGLITARIQVTEGAPVMVTEVTLEIGQGLKFPASLPIQEGEIFVEQNYIRAAEILQEYFLRHGRAYVETDRKAEVNLDRSEARVWYHVHPGRLAVFGDTTVEGVERYDPELVLREVTYRRGQAFSIDEVSRTRDNIVGLGLFGRVIIAPGKVEGTPAAVPIEIQVTEAEPREIRARVGYSTEEEFRVQLEWHHLNWFGGGRRLTVLGRYSAILATGAISFTQPHFLSPRNQGLLTLRHDREDEQAYLLNASRFHPLLVHRFSRYFSGYVGYRLEHHLFDDVSPATVQAIGGLRDRGIRSGPAVGLLWDSLDDPLNPATGRVFRFDLDQAGGIWGGRFSFWRTTVEARQYLPIGWDVILAGRLRLGLADSIGRIRNLPLHERFFAGGDASVRGYGRRRVGPLSAANHPIGGLSLFEGSVEMRRPLWESFGGALFLDFGQVSTRAFRPPLDDLKFGAGVGFFYTTPVGPLRFDVGFPFQPPRGDPRWQIHFSIGGFF